MRRLSLRAALGVGVVAASFWVAPGVGAACEPARVTSDIGALPEAWRRALDALVAATAREGQPWSCTGARLSLTLDAASSAAILRVDDAPDRSSERRVPSPDDLVSIGEALLAVPARRNAADRAEVEQPESKPKESKPTEIEPPPRAAPPKAEPEPARALPSGEGSAGRPPDGPKLLLDVGAAARYMGPTRALYWGSELLATLQLARWSAGVWARFDLPAWIFDATPEDFDMSEVSIGLSLGRTLISAPIELTAAFAPSLAVISMEGELDEIEAEGAKLDPRLGIGLRAAWPIAGRWRGIAALGGEVAPGALGDPARRRIDPALPPVPSYSIGLTLGVEVVVIQ